MKKALLIVAALVALGVVAALLMMGYLWGKPLYEPGSVRAAVDLDAPLDPPAQEGVPEGFCSAPSALSA